MSEPGVEIESELIRPRRRVRWAAYALLFLVVFGTIGGEVVARYALGLGDPPLFRLDPEIEYELIPNRAYRRLGNSFEVNAYSMRSAPFPEAKASSDELRVLVVGDSIINGGAWIDQGELATELLRKSLNKRLGRPVVVGNASAASWGPPNELAYVKKHGTLDADVVVLVLNSEDITDVPGIEGIGSSWPVSKPVLALQEVFEYIVRKFEMKSGRRLGPAPKRKANPPVDMQESLAAVDALIAMVRAHGAKVALVLHAKRSEATGAEPMGGGAFRELAGSLNVPVYDTGDAMNKSILTGEEPYRRGDNVHTNAHGQRILEQVLERAVLDVLEARPGNSRPNDG